MSAAQWGGARAVGELRAADLSQAGVVFADRGYLYRTTGQPLSEGGMGTVVLLERIAEAAAGAPDQAPEVVVGKTFHHQYLYQLRTDEVTRRDHETTMRAGERIARLGHPNLLPTYVSARIADNHLTITPRKPHTLLELVARGELPPRQRVERLIEALEGLRALHEARVVHRDLTLRNILVDAGAARAYLFDFDLALGLDDLGPVSYKTHYRGRIFGSPGYSVPPEILDPALMESALTPRLDIYAIGGALFALFTDQLLYGDTEDMWGLLVRIAEGVVVRGVSQVRYPAAVPECLRPVIDGCLERDPGDRFGSVSLVIGELRQRLPQLEGAPEDRHRFHRVTQTGGSTDARARLEAVHAERRDPSVNLGVIEIVDTILGRYGYQLQRALGRVKGFPIFMAAPTPELIASGQFPDANTYPKIVTAMNLGDRADAAEIVERWLGRYLPALTKVRQGLVTTLHRVVYDEWSAHLLLFSEFVVNPRFGPDLELVEPTVPEALGVGFLAVRQVGRLHEQGLAHNNIRPQSLLLKGLRETGQVHPAMVGLVDPSLDPAAMAVDVRNLAALIRSWILPTRVEALDPARREAVAHLCGQLDRLAYEEHAEGPGIDELIATVANGLAAIDTNFAILRRHGGDLREYVLLLVSQRLYPRLFT